MNYQNENPLEMIELYAEEVGSIASEEELSEVFDRNIAPSIIKHYGEDDEPAMNEGFSNWKDSLSRDGEIHPLQDNEYCYVGKWS